MNRRLSHAIFKKIAPVLIYGIFLQPFGFILAQSPIPAPYDHSQSLENITQEEQTFLDAHPDVHFVYIPLELYDIIAPLADQVTSHPCSALLDVCDLIQHNVHIVRYDVMVQALTECLEQKTLDLETKELLTAYQEELTTEQGPATRAWYKVYNNLLVRNKLQTNSLLVRHDATIEGNLIVDGTINSSSGVGVVTGPSTSTINAVPRYADTSGNLLKDSSVLVDDSGNITIDGITKSGNTVSWPTTVGAAGTFLGSDGAGNLIYSTPAGSGNVDTASNFTVNNRIITTDLPSGSQNIKQSTVTLDTSGNITGVAGLTMTGNLNIEGQSAVRLQDSGGSGNYVGLNAPAAVGTSYTLSLPDTAPTVGQFLQAGATTANDLAWITVATVTTPATTRTIYVSKAGNDTTGNGAVATPYLTLAKAIDTANGLSSASNPVTISVQSGTYVENNSAGPLTITASGISISGASIEGVIIQPSTPSQALLLCTVNTLEFDNFTIDAGAGGSTASGIVFSSNAAGTTRFNAVAAYRFLTGFECNGSDGTPILIFNNVQPRGNTTAIAFSSCRGLIKNCTFLGPFSGSTVSNTGVTTTGSTSLITILSNSFRLMQTAISAAGQSNIRILGSNIESSTNGIVCSAASHNDIVGCNFVVNNSSSINVIGTDAGTQVHLAGCHFDCADGDGIAQGTALKVTSDAGMFIDACGISDCVTAIQCGEAGDTASTVLNVNATSISRCTNDITQNGSSTLNFNAGTASDSKISINDSTNVQLALFDVEDNNQLHIGKFTDVNTDLLQAFISSGDNPQIDYLSSLYSSQAIGYNNPNSNPTSWFAKSNQNTNLTSITTDRTKAAGVRLVSDTAAPVGGTTALRGWDITKNATTAELAFQYQNSDVTGQSVITQYTVTQLDGVNNQLQLPTAGTQIVFASDTNLYRSAADTLKTDDSFTAAGTITATSGFSGNLTGNVTGAASLNVLKAGDTMTGALALPAGSAASPQLQFTGSTNTGLSAGTANVLSFDTNGSERMNISSSGVAIPSMTTAGVVHNAATTGLLSSSLIVNADITDATITNAKLATISSANTASNIVVRDSSGNFATNMITIAGTTTNSTDVATKAYVDTVASTGLKPVSPVIVVNNVSNTTLSGTPTIDGVTVTADAGNTVLLNAQTNAVNNGIWVVNSGAWTRPTTGYFQTGNNAQGIYVFVDQGTTYAGSSWVNTNATTAIIGTNNLTFGIFSDPGTVTGANVGAGAGEVFRDTTGNTLNFRTLNAGSHITIDTDTTLANTVTIAAPGASTNTPSTLVARDGSGNFSAGTITASLTGHASLDLPLTGGTLSGTLTLPAGSAGTPALNFTGSTTTGLSAATADTLSLDTAGVERMKLNSSGVTIPGLSSAGVVHNSAAGLLSTSLIVNADITDATIANAKLATIDSANTAGAIVVRDGSGNFSAGTITANLAGNVTGAASLNVLKAGDTMTGALLMPTGSAATPALQVGATNVGLSSQSSGLTLSTNGTARLTVSSAGTVAITDAAGGFTTAGIVHNDASGNLTSSLIVNADIAAGAAIADTKLATISTAGKVSNSATTATSSNTPSTIVLRDGSGDFSAGTITANNFVGNISGYLPLAGGTLTGSLTLPAGSAGSPSLLFTGGTNTGISSATANTLSFDTSGVERVTINSTGLSAAAAITAGTGLTATTGGVTASAGNIVATLGNINATAGSMSAGTTVTAGTGMTVTAGAITVPGGSAAAPSVRFANGTTTGMSAPSANNLALSTGGTSRLGIDSSGNVTYSSNYKMSAYVGTDRTITSATETVRYDTETFDPNSNFNTTTWTYTAPVTGYYLVSAQVYFFANSSSNATPRTIQLVKNGSALTGYSSSTTSITANQFGTLNIVSLVQLTATNTLRVDFSGITTSGGDQIQANGSSLNIHFMSI